MQEEGRKNQGAGSRISRAETETKYCTCTCGLLLLLVGREVAGDKWLVGFNTKTRASVSHSQASLILIQPSTTPTCTTTR